MYEGIDLVELKRMADICAAEPPQNFDMTTWFCGTHGCLIGTWSKHSPNDCLRVEYDEDEGQCIPRLEDDVYEDAIRKRFGLNGITGFLFTSHTTDFEALSCDASFLSQEQAVARLRKYIAYVERKRALFAEHEWLMSLSRRDRMARLMAPRELQTAGSGAKAE